MNATANEIDFLAELFSFAASTGPTQAEIAAAEVAEMKAEKAARVAAEIAARCPRCMGAGRLAQFTHRKGGECFLCGGSGVFSSYKG
jgi:hypothetical protein